LRKNLTRRELAVRAGVSLFTINQIENRHHHHTIAAAERLPGFPARTLPDRSGTT